jgi:hypothetical protein
MRQMAPNHRRTSCSKLGMGVCVTNSGKKSVKGCSRVCVDVMHPDLYVEFRV